MRNGSDLGTIIGQDASVEGKLIVKHEVRVDGEIKGELTSTDTITVGTSGRVEGVISGENVVIGGAVEGNIKATGRLTLEGGSRFDGDLEAARLVIVEGAVFNGRSTMSSDQTGSSKNRPQINLEPDSDI
ncbi:MAG: polymer-forming cytoskeletal protein [bacterium]